MNSEDDARDPLAQALRDEPITLIDLLGMHEGADIEFEPERLGLTARSAPVTGDDSDAGV